MCRESHAECPNSHRRQLNEWVAFATPVPLRGDDDANDGEDVYLWEKSTGNVTLVSTFGGITDPGAHSPAISGDGHWVAFATPVQLRGDVDGNSGEDVFLACFE